MNYCGLGKDNDMSVLHRLGPLREKNRGDPEKVATHPQHLDASTSLGVCG